MNAPVSYEASRTFSVTFLNNYLWYTNPDARSGKFQLTI